jgi:hypothetical protein
MLIVIIIMCDASGTHHPQPVLAERRVQLRRVDKARVVGVQRVEQVHQPQLLVLQHVEDPIQRALNGGARGIPPPPPLPLIPPR